MNEHLVLTTQPCCDAPADAVSIKDWRVEKGDPRTVWVVSDWRHTGFFGATLVPAAGFIKTETPTELCRIVIHEWVRGGVSYASWHFTELDAA